MSARFKRFYSAPTAVFIDCEGCLLDHGCMVSVGAITKLFKERGVEITDFDAASKAPSLIGTDLTCKKTHLRHVLMNVCKDQWTAAKGTAPTEWDLESLFKDFNRIVIDELRGVKPIRGAPEAIRSIQEQGMQVGIASNYTGEVMDAWLRVTHHHGFQSSCAMSCAEVPNPGRDGAFTCVLPDPWRCMAMAAKMNIYPLATTIRVSTTLYGIEEGLNAGMWTIALAGTGLVSPFIHGSETEVQRKRRTAGEFYKLGCHYVLDGPWDLPDTVADIESRMRKGETP